MMQRWPMIDRSEIGAALLYSLAGSSSKMGEFVVVTFLPAATVSCLFLHLPLYLVRSCFLSC